MHSTDTSISQDQSEALAAARELVYAGVPVFRAPACPPGCPLPGHDGRGWHIPKGWPTTPAYDIADIEAWRSGDALAAVCGHTLDAVDVDPRNGGEATFAALVAAGVMPFVYASAATPSGGTHHLVAALGMAKGVAGPGVDIQAGAPDGTGRGFVFIAPTVRASQVDGVMRAYRWMHPPDAEMIRAEAGGDDTGTALAEILRRQKPPSDHLPAQIPAGRFATHREWWTRDEARAECERIVGEFAGQGYAGHSYNAQLNDLAYRVGHFVGGGFLAHADAVAWLRDAAGAAGMLTAPAGHSYVPDGERKVTATIASGLAAGMRAPYSVFEPPDLGKDSAAVAAAPDDAGDRRVDLMPYLDGSYIAPEPTVGGELEGSRWLLYPGRWHTMIATTGAGKSWWALWHAVSEMRRGAVVAYAHFEEASPVITLERLRAIAPEMDNETICKLLVWLDCTRAWADGEFAAALPADARLVVLDGINAAATAHRGDPNSPEGVAAYRARFVAPACARGAAVLSLGHPPKGRDRQDERHGFGSTAWLDEVDGVGFRMRAAKPGPVRRGHDGAADIYCVKDRGGAVEARGQRDDGESREGWTYLGRFHVDSSPGRANTVSWMTGPSMVTGGRAVSVDDGMTAKVLDALDALAVADIEPTASNIAATARAKKQTVLDALVRLRADGVLTMNEVGQSHRYARAQPVPKINEDQDP